MTIQSIKQPSDIDYQYLQPLLDALTYMNDDDIVKVREAYALAYDGHRFQTRSSGLPYITHPVAVANILADLKLDLPSIQAAILHDVIEDTEYTREDLVARFGETVAAIVDGVSKIDKLKFRTRQEAEVANFRKMILAMTKDIRVVLIKLADRTHNSRTLDALPRAKQQRIATETLSIYAALAYRLGIMPIKTELEDLSFKALFPLRNSLLEKAIDKATDKLRNQIDNCCEQILQRVKDLGINNVKVVPERLSTYYIYDRLRRNKKESLSKSFSSIFDIYRFIIVVDDVDSCYRVLGAVHGMYKPIPQSFKDYIAIPRTTGFQSLITDLLDQQGNQVEIQIRSQAMDEIAELGIATTLTYTPNSKNLIGKERIQEWLDSLSELRQAPVNSIEFNNSVKKEIFPEDIFVFSPRGKIVEMPKGATCLDFAYYIHSNIGDHAVSALVDGKEASLDQVVHNGQTIEIIVDPESKPTESMLSQVKTTRGRSKLRQALKDLQFDTYITQGKEYLNKVYQGNFDKVNYASIERALEFFNLSSVNELFVEICLGNIISPVARAVIDSYEDPNVDVDNIFVELSSKTLKSGLTYQDLINRGIKVVIHPSALVVPDDEIMVCTNHGDGLTIHHAKAKFGQSLTAYQQIRLDWGVNEIAQSPVEINLTLRNPNGDSGRELSERVQKQLEQQGLTASVAYYNDYSENVTVVLRSEATNKAQVETLIKELKQLFVPTGNLVNLERVYTDPSARR